MAGARNPRLLQTTSSQVSPWKRYHEDPNRRHDDSKKTPTGVGVLNENVQPRQKRFAIHHAGNRKLSVFPLAL